MKAFRFGITASLLLVVMTFISPTASAVPAVGACGDYTPGSLTIDDLTLNPGQTFTVTGTGCPGDVIDITLTSASGVVTTLGSVTVGADGRFTFTSTLPSPLAAGEYVLTAKSRTTSLSTRLTVTVNETVLGVTTTRKPADNNNGGNGGGTVSPSGSNGRVLARTGAEIRSTLAAGSAIVALGVCILAMVRRRKTGQ